MKTEGNDIINGMVVPTKATDKGVIVAQDIHLGLTKREYFAAMAMQAYISNSKLVENIKLAEKFLIFPLKILMLYWQLNRLMRLLEPLTNQ